MAQTATKRGKEQGAAPKVAAVALTGVAGGRTTALMVSILLTLNAVICVGLIILILLQRSEASSGGMFGGAGSGSQNIIRNPLAKPTAVLAALFLVFSIAAAVMNKGGAHGDSVMAQTPEATAPASPVLPEAALPGAAVSPSVDSLLMTASPTTPAPAPAK